ncbi:MAG: AMP-binding protein [Pseudomonadota bacterium]
MPLSQSLFDLGPPPPCPARFNMARHVLSSGANPDKRALGVLGEGGALIEDWRYRDLDRAIRATAAGLRARGLKPGERVALRMANTADFPILFFATIAAGAIAVPTSAALTAPEFARLCTDMTPRFIAVSEGLEVETPPGTTLLGPDDWRALRETPPGAIAETAAEDPAFLVYTSGTSGQPKGVLHAQRSAWARQMMWEGWYGLGRDDIMLHAGAFNWTYTLGAGLTDPWAAGASTLIYTGPRDPAIWPRLIERHGATLFAAVPGVYRQMLRGGEDLRAQLASLRHGLTAGERLSEHLAETWSTRTATPLYEALGMSECSTYVSSSPSVPRRPGTAGRPQAGRRVGVVDDTGAVLPLDTPGHLAIDRRDPGLMLGYWGRSEDTATAQQGNWFLTGDRARMDAEGYITHEGRSDEVMNALGYRVAPMEVEEALATHPAIAEIAVAELPVRADLSLIAAFVVARDWPGEDALSRFAAEHLASYKCPKLWIAVEALPRTANGKLLRRALVETHRRDRD